MTPSPITRLHAWDLTAFAELYDLTYEKIYRFVYHRTMDTMEAQDIVSDVYMKALKKIKSFRGNTEWEFFSWLYRIAYTSIIDRSRQRDENLSLDELEYDPWFDPKNESRIADELTLASVLAYLDTLPKRDKDILIMRIWDDMSYQEISDVTWITNNNAKKIVSRTLTKIVANVPHLTTTYVLFLSPLLIFYSW